MQRPSPRKLEDHRRLAERAAEWLSVLKSPTPEERAEFAEWLAASPQHAEEFLLVTALNEQLSKIELETFPQVRETLARACANVVPLAAQLPNKSAAVRRRWPLALAAGVAVAALGTSVSFRVANPSPVYTTATGEQRTVKLADGSTMELNTASRVRVRFSADVREVRLLQGEALFSVHRDPLRPFRVTTDTVLVQAVGTRFNVYRNEQGTKVSVVDGRVKVVPLQGKSAPASSNGEPSLGAGEEADIAADGRVVRRTAPDDIARSIAWREQRLVFLSDTLKDIAVEFNRYNRAPRILVEDENAGARRYSGVFDSDDPRSLIEFLREDAALELREQDGELRVRARE